MPRYSRYHSQGNHVIKMDLVLHRLQLDCRICDLPDHLPRRQTTRLLISHFTGKKVLRVTIANVLITAVIIGYAVWMVVRHIKRSKEGKCAACSAKKGCESASCVPPSAKP
ncbi:Virus attachment protein p12 family protein [compost metagenome]